MFSATHGLWVLSVVVVATFLSKTFVGNHPNSLIAQGMSYYL